MAFERVYDLLDFPASIADSALPLPLVRPALELQFQAVSFRHPGPREAVPSSLLAENAGDDDAGDRWVLEDISFTVQPGGMTAIVGATGAGKSTSRR